MPGLILPRRFNSQPQGRVELNPKYDARIVWSAPNSGLIVTPNGLSDGVLTNSTGWAEAVTPAGVARVPGQNGLQIDYAASFYSADASFLLVGNAPPNNTWNVCALTPFGSLRRWEGNYAIHLPTNAVRSIASAAQWSTTGSQSVVVVRTNLSGSVRGFMVDGVAKSTLTTNFGSAYNPSSYNILQSMFGDRSSATYWASSTSLIAAFDRLLTDDEAVELTAEPNLVFRKRARVLYFDVAAPSAAPTLSFPLATSITSTSAVPQVTLTFA